MKNQEIRNDSVGDKILADLANRQTIDFADIGDAENDPFLRKTLRADAAEQGDCDRYDGGGRDIGFSICGCVVF